MSRFRLIHGTYACLEWVNENTMRQHQPELHPIAYSSVFIRFIICIFYFHVVYAYDTLVQQDLTFSAKPMETGSAAHP